MQHAHWTSIVRAAVGEKIKEFDDNATLNDVWAFVSEELANSRHEKAVVLEDGDNQKLGEILDSSLYYAFWETPEKMRSHFNLNGFDQYPADLD